MKKRLVAGVAALALAGMAVGHGRCAAVAGEAADARGKEEKVETQKVKLPETSKVLVVYYSRTGNTKEIAQFIQQKTGAVVFAIEPLASYPEDYQATTEQAKREIAEGLKPPLKVVVENIDAFDTVFVGSPNWWSTIAPPVATFLAGHDLAGKTVIPFFTHGGGGMARCEEDVKKMLPKATFKKGMTFSGGQAKNAKKEVDVWVDGLGLAAH